MAERGEMVPIKGHYDPRTNSWDPSYDPKHADRGTITGRDTHQPPKTSSYFSRALGWQGTETATGVTITGRSPARG